MCSGRNIGGWYRRERVAEEALVLPWKHNVSGLKEGRPLEFRRALC